MCAENVSKPVTSTGQNHRSDSTENEIRKDGQGDIPRPSKEGGGERSHSGHKCNIPI